MVEEKQVSGYDAVGKNTLLPYLLNHGLKTIDFVILSHMDIDHCGSAMYIMQKLKVKNVIITKQYEKSENYEEFIKIVKKRNIKVSIVEAGQIINIEKGIYFNVLWPTSKNIINENVLNNNSLVCKLVYKNFSMLFTGDIEEISEKAIIDEYKSNLEILKADILKVAHHGSKTSSTIEFLEAVQPKIALIGVGEDNKFGHPSNITLNRLKEIRCMGYRTDKNGEIIVKINKNGRIRVDKMLN